ncbi:acidic repeat-containing protein-like [Belonocnema kinseyi]|uniref:acidic repeat-containing protein-like n=1 Tax=Belonocnema kinseyi TaxID=2817044 RepID=UPI00143D9E20|nr:acidic repeat-containing protein-like [Belonocnema kinseyi]
MQALPFKVMFRKKKELCKKLYRFFNWAVFENELPNTMKIEWVQDVTEYWVGGCQLRWREDNSNKKIRSEDVVIKLRTEFVDTADRVRDTLVHKMCHAAVWLLDENMEDDHGPYGETRLQHPT